MATDTTADGPIGAAQIPAKPANDLRKRLFTGLGGVVAVGALIYGGWWFLSGSHHVTTDDAYVGADMAQITPQVTGAVIEVPVADTEVVKTGQPLVVIDPTDAKLALAQAEANYASAVRRVRQSLATTDAAGAQVLARNADLARAKAQTAVAGADLARARLDAQRREALAASGAVSGEELTNARTALHNAEANFGSAKAAEAQAEANVKVASSQSQAQAAMTVGAGVDDNPEVKLARAALDTARVNLDRTTLRAPFNGVVAKRNVQIGQRVAVGAQLMSIIPVDRVYVDANYKEVQLRKMKVGQEVELESDLYGSSVKYHGKVVGVGGGTGSAFAIIPAQNATGNWIKVVQRLPVRIALDPKELAEHPLRVGLSMKADVNTASQH
jgi:membrane fusion protein (multidrug efflux system)